MSELKTVTPEMIDDELVREIRSSISSAPTITETIRIVLAYLANNPRVPTLDDAESIVQKWHEGALPGNNFTQAVAVEYQRRAYLKREPELPDEVKGLLWKANPFANQGAEYRHDEAVRQAYALGLQKGAAK